MYCWWNFLWTFTLTLLVVSFTYSWHDRDCPPESRQLDSQAKSDCWNVKFRNCDNYSFQVFVLTVCLSRCSTYTIPSAKTNAAGLIFLWDSNVTVCYLESLISIMILSLWSLFSLKFFMCYFSYLQVCFARSCIFSWRFNEDDSVSMCYYGRNHK